MGINQGAIKALQNQGKQLELTLNRARQQGEFGSAEQQRGQSKFNQFVQLAIGGGGGGGQG